MLFRRLGGAVLIASIVAGQLAAGLVLDHFGLLEFVKNAFRATRLAGAALLFAGCISFGVDRYTAPHFARRQVQRRTLFEC